MLEKEEWISQHVQTKSGRMERDGGSTHQPTHPPRPCNFYHQAQDSIKRLVWDHQALGSKSLNLQKTLFSAKLQTECPLMKRWALPSLLCSTRPFTWLCRFKGLWHSIVGLQHLNIRRRSLLNLIVRNSWSSNTPLKSI